MIVYQKKKKYIRYFNQLPSALKHKNDWFRALFRIRGQNPNQRTKSLKCPYSINWFEKQKQLNTTEYSILNQQISLERKITLNCQ